MRADCILSATDSLYEEEKKEKNGRKRTMKMKQKKNVLI